MSLINEALKKARVEAAQRDARQRGVLVPKAAAYGPRRGTGRIALAVVAGALALGLSAAGGMWLARRGLPAEAGGAAATPEAASGEVGSRAAPGSASAEPGGPAPAEATEEEEAIGSVAAPAAAREVADPGPPAAPGTDRPGRPREATAGSPPASEPAAGTETAGAPAPASSAAAAEAPARGTPQRPAGPPRARPASAPPAGTPSRTEPGYVREAPLPGGGTLRLDGIAWSETAPTAVIDGQIVGPGERIRGAWVRRIERDRVVLEADGSEIVVRLR